MAHAVETIEEMVHLLGPGLLQDDDLTHITKLLLALFTQQTNCQVGLAFISLYSANTLAMAAALIMSSVLQPRDKSSHGLARP